MSHYNPGTCYGNQITVFLVLREDLSILPQKDTILRMNDIMVIREEKKNNRIGKRYAFRQLFLEILYKNILRKLSKTYIAKRGLFR